MKGKRPSPGTDLQGLGPQPLGHGPRRGHIALIGHRLRARPEQNVAFQGRGDVDAQIRVVAGRHRVDRHRELRPRLLVGDQVLAAKGKDAPAVKSRQGGDFVGEKPGRVDHTARDELSPRCRQEEAVRTASDRRHGRFELHPNTVAPSAFGQGDGQLVGRNDPRSGRVEGPQAAHARRQALDRGPVDDLEARHPVALALGPELLEPRHIGLGQGHDQLAGHPVRDSERLGQSIDQPQPLDVEAGLERARRDVEPGVDDPAVALADPLGQVRRLLQEDDPQVVAGQLPGDGAADDTAADHGHIINEAPTIAGRPVFRVGHRHGVVPLQAWVWEGGMIPDRSGAANPGRREERSPTTRTLFPGPRGWSQDALAGGLRSSRPAATAKAAEIGMKARPKTTYASRA